MKQGFGKLASLEEGSEKGDFLLLSGNSSAITTLGNAAGFIEIDENTEVLEKGTEVEVMLF